MWVDQTDKFDNFGFEGFRPTVPGGWLRMERIAFSPASL
jgi:hypothetical protein